MASILIMKNFTESVIDCNPIVPQNFVLTHRVNFSHCPVCVSTLAPPLSHLVRSHQLTESLNWIEQNLGFTGDTAIFVLSAVNEEVQ